MEPFWLIACVKNSSVLVELSFLKISDSDGKKIVERVNGAPERGSSGKIFETGFRSNGSDAIQSWIAKLN